MICFYLSLDSKDPSLTVVTFTIRFNLVLVCLFIDVTPNRGLKGISLEKKKICSEKRGFYTTSDYQNVTNTFTSTSSKNSIVSYLSILVITIFKMMGCQSLRDDSCK